MLLVSIAMYGMEKLPNEMDKGWMVELAAIMGMRRFQSGWALVVTSSLSSFRATLSSFWPLVAMNLWALSLMASSFFELLPESMTTRVPMVCIN